MDKTPFFHFIETVLSLFLLNTRRDHCLRQKRLDEMSAGWVGDHVKLIHDDAADLAKSLLLDQRRDNRIRLFDRADRKHLACGSERYRYREDTF
jgi:hypothetical protein